MNSVMIARGKFPWRMFKESEVWSSQPSGAKRAARAARAVRRQSWWRARAGMGKVAAHGWCRRRAVIGKTMEPLKLPDSWAVSTHESTVAAMLHVKSTALLQITGCSSGPRSGLPVLRRAPDTITLLVLYGLIAGPPLLQPAALASSSAGPVETPCLSRHLTLFFRNAIRRHAPEGARGVCSLALDGHRQVNLHSTFTRS
jgi:hypothetical protein